MARAPRARGGTAHLEEAVAAYREAWQELPRKRVPLDCATTTGNQCVALRFLSRKLPSAGQ